jgi:hypothetical protein
MSNDIPIAPIILLMKDLMVLAGAAAGGVPTHEPDDGNISAGGEGVGVGQEVAKSRWQLIVHGDTYCKNGFEDVTEDDRKLVQAIGTGARRA